MKYYTLGEDTPHPLKVSECCLGTMTFGEQANEAASFAMMTTALAMGCNFFDVAEMYPVPPRAETCGDSERIVGKWLAEDPSRREKVVIATKVTSRSAGPRLAHVVGKRKYAPGEETPSTTALTRQQILAACDGSLERLGISCIDLYQLHWPDRYSPIFDKRCYKRSEEWADFTPFDETVSAVAQLLKDGKIKQWGVSNENAFGVTKLLEACERIGVQRPVTIQNDFSVLHRRFEEDGTAEACSPLHSGVKPNGIALLVYGALAGGMLCGKYSVSKDGTLTCSDKRARHALFPAFQPRYHSGACVETSEKLVNLAAEWKLSPTALALLWCRSRDYLGSVIIGATGLEQLKECVGAFELPQLNDEQLRRIDEACTTMFTPYYSRVGEYKVGAA